MSNTSFAANLKTAFDRDGFVVVREFFDATQVKRIVDEIDRYVMQVAPHVPPAFVMYEDTARPDTLKQIAYIAHYDEALRQFLNEGPAIRIAETLFGRSARGIELEWFDKPPGASRATPPHQDGYYFKIAPKEAVTLWVALDRIDKENGCIRYVASSHHLGLRPHVRTDVLGFSQGVSDYGPDDEAREVAVVAEPGDLLAHHCLTIHRADANSSRRHRRALGLIYYSDRVKEDVEARDAYLKNLHADWKKEGKIRG